MLSHMRAYTSLLGHILGSHPEINGYYELHLSYTSEQDLTRQQQLYTQNEPLKPDSLYLFDKLLHNDYQLDLRAIQPISSKLLITLRPPESTIPSIVHLFSSKTGRHSYADPVKATQYYIERLQSLAQFSVQNAQSFYYFDAQLLHSSTTEILPRLTSWLNLQSPLSDRYQLFSQTGAARAGDSSASIKSGRVVKTPNSYSGIDIDSELMHQAHLSYQNHRQVIIQNAIDAELVC